MLSEAYFFGTFNPIHLGHLAIAEAALRVPGIEQVIFIPSPQPPHRLQEADMAPAVDRLAMVRLATAGHPNFRVSDIELQRCGPSYTVDTLSLLHPPDPAQCIQESMPRIPLVFGGDALAQLGTWHKAETLLARGYFLQAPRPGTPPVTHVTLNGIPVALPSGQVLDTPPNALSASWVRQQLHRGNSLRYTVPPAVLEYITWNGLYGVS